MSEGHGEVEGDEGKKKNDNEYDIYLSSENEGRDSWLVWELGRLG